MMLYILWFNIFIKDFIYLLLERANGREKEERNSDVQKIHRSVGTPPTGDLACNPDMCPDLESNQWTLSSQVRA